MPGGDTIQVEHEQKGSTPSTPFMTKYGQGWNITLPDGTLMEPGQKKVVDVYVEAPPNAREGDVNILQIRVSDAVGKGMEVFQVPVRVIGSSNYNIKATSDWYISSAGGYPLAWVENTGNDLPEMEFDVLNLPVGWTTSIDSPIAIVPGEIHGLPINLIPPTDWDKNPFTISVEVTHSTLGSEQVDFTVHSSAIAFAESPVLWARSGTQLSIEFHNDGGQAVSNEQGVTSDTTHTFSIPNGLEYVNLSSGDDQIQLALIGREIPQTSVLCSFVNQAFTDLGKAPYSGDIVTCEVLGDPATSTKISFVVATNRGESIPLGVTTFNILENESTYTNLSVMDWDPAPGSFTLVVSAFDEFGNVISTIDREFTSRESGWNVGISSISAKGTINVALLRTNYVVLEDAVCVLLVESRDSAFKAEVKVEFAGTTFDANKRIDAAGLDDKEQLDAEIRCNTPFDVDDDPNDDSATIIFELEEPSALSSSNILWGAAVSIVLVGVYLFIVQRQANAALREMVRKQPKPKTPVEKQPAAREEIVEDDISISIESDDVEEEAPPSMIEEIPAREDLTPSGRLDSIRKELSPEEETQQQSSIEERMSKFFD